MFGISNIKKNARLSLVGCKFSPGDNKKKSMDTKQADKNKLCCSEHFFSNEKRCCCGKLLAKQTDTGIVIRCARCKQEMIIDFSQVSKEYTPV